MKIPEVRIMFSEILYNTISTDIQRIKEKEGHEMATVDQCLEWTKAYRKAWEPKATLLLEGMSNLFGLEFYRPVIDVSLAPWIKPISKPILISYYYEPDQFIDMLIHELLHVLQTDNTNIKYDDRKLESVRKIWLDQFGGEHTFKTLVHIPVHAGLKAIYLDILHEPYRLQRDIETSQKWPDYTAAWEYVEANDYNQIIEKLKNSYTQ
jgi:hypothetical protein